MATVLLPPQIGFGMVLNSGGNWYLNVSNENAKSAAHGCFFAAFLYAGYVAFCGLRVCKLVAKSKAAERESMLDRYD